MRTKQATDDQAAPTHQSQTQLHPFQKGYPTTVAGDEDNDNSNQKERPRFSETSQVSLGLTGTGRYAIDRKINR